MNSKNILVLVSFTLLFLIGSSFIQNGVFIENNFGGTATLSHTNDLVSSYANCSGPETRSVGVLSAGGWDARVTTNSPWIHVLDPSTGQGDGFVQYQAEQNFSPNVREGVITIGGEDFTLTQEAFDPGATCPIGVNRSEHLADSAGGPVDFLVDDWGFDIDWRATILTGDFLLFDSETGRPFTPAVLRVQSNSLSSSRMALVTIGSKKIPIIQRAGTR